MLLRRKKLPPDQDLDVSLSVYIHQECVLHHVRISFGLPPLAPSNRALDLTSLSLNRIIQEIFLLHGDLRRVNLITFILISTVNEALGPTTDPLVMLKPEAGKWFSNRHIADISIFTGRHLPHSSIGSPSHH